MKTHSRILGLTIVAMLAFSGLSAASASAGDKFFVGGSELVGEASTTSSGGAFTLGTTLGGVHLTISCSSMVGTGGTIKNDAGQGGMGHATNVNLHFTSCVITGVFGTKCKVNSSGAAAGTITINNMTGTANSSGTITFSPQAGGPIGTLVISAISTPPCNIAGSYQVTGFLMGREEGGELVFDEASGSSLELGGNAATLEGKSTTDVGGSLVTIP